jgi:hypothetical protein
LWCYDLNYSTRPSTRALLARVKTTETTSYDAIDNDAKDLRPSRSSIALFVLVASDLDKQYSLLFRPLPLSLSRLSLEREQIEIAALARAQAECYYYYYYTLHGTYVVDSEI